ncbi:MAG: hypothetical protein GWP25_00820 [Euryarchaeota archaeon]|nr:hypothetical protein [Euryarchaeota archaeon]
MDSLQSLTVIELKEILRGQGKKISGTKKELILRLENGVEEKYLSLDDDSTPLENTESTSVLKKRISCKYCFQILNIPEEYEGKWSVRNVIAVSLGTSNRPLNPVHLQRRSCVLQPSHLSLPLSHFWPMG